MKASLRALLEHKGRDVETVDPDTSVFVAVQRMNVRHIGALVITDEQNLVGIMTERDVLTRVVATNRDPTGTRVWEVMTRDPVIIDADATVEEALGVVSSRRCRHLPVVHQNALYGLVSAGDLTAWIVRDQRRTIDDLYDYVTR